ncbi:hypothetical protein PAXRUDRAFT_161677, partial [Paxillus rubicundulus Ve08.2h10]
HASACNIIERIFGVLKHWFHVLLMAPEYDLDTQAHIPSTLCTIHNFIYAHPFMDDWNNLDYHYIPDIPHIQGYAGDEELEVGGNGKFKRMCNNITQEVWADYQGILMVELDDFDLLEEELLDHGLAVIF